MTQPIYRPVADGEILNSNGLFIEAGQSGGWLLHFGKGGPSVWFPDAVRLCEAVPYGTGFAPKADWSKAPAQAMWWCVDADGDEAWHEQEPTVRGWSWASGGDCVVSDERIDIPLGIDWRTLIEKRPQEVSDGPKANV